VKELVGKGLTHETEYIMKQLAFNVKERGSGKG
jgi:hypothetical protein